MLKAVTGLCFLLILSACAYSPSLSAPLLKSIDGQTWYLDIDRMSELNQQARNEMARNGREDFILRYGDIGFRLTLSEHGFIIYKARDMVLPYDNFTVIGQDEEHAKLLLPVEYEPNELEINLTLRGDALVLRVSTVGADESEGLAEAMAFARPRDGIEPQALLNKAREAAGRYVLENYGWDKSDYSIELYPEGRADYDILNILVAHNDDLKPLAPRGGKSLVLELDRQNLAIIRELRFQ